MTSLFKMLTACQYFHFQKYSQQLDIEKEQNNEKYKAFNEELMNVSTQFIEHVLEDVRKRIYDEFDTFTKIIDWSVANNSQNQILE